MKREAMDECHACHRKIKGRMVYTGGTVWHPSCWALWPSNPANKPKKKTRKR